MGMTSLAGLKAGHVGLLVIILMGGLGVTQGQLAVHGGTAAQMLLWHGIDGGRLLAGEAIGMEGAPKAPGDDLGAPRMVAFQSWRGFALQGEQAHPLKMTIENLRPIAPTDVRRLLSSNMTIEEIREIIKKEESSAVYRGVMRLSDDLYLLRAVKVTTADNTSTIESAVVAPAGSDWTRHDWRGCYDNDTITVGHLVFVVQTNNESNISGIAEGTLTINHDNYIGTYKVILDEDRPARDRMGMVGMMGPMMDEPMERPMHGDPH
jgi:hypothetical protein